MVAIASKGEHDASYRDPAPRPRWARTNRQARAQRQLEGLKTSGLREYAIFPLDAGGRVSGWNTAAERVQGYRGEQIIGQHRSVFHPPERVEAGYPDWELVQAAREGFWIDEGWRVRGDGTWFWAHVVITAQHSPHGDLEGFITVTRDETESRAREQRSGERFVDLFDLMPTGLALVDESGRLLEVNIALADMVESHPEDLYGRPLATLLDPVDPSVNLTSRRDVGGWPDGDEWVQRRLRAASGRHVICDIAGADLTQDDGSRVRVLVFQDVTERDRDQEAWHYQAIHDDLTGLLNRTGLNELLDQVLPEADGRAGMLFCDLDNFKRVNDSLGHHAGDELLVALARHLQAELPAGCVPARFSGDEFLIACTNVDAHGGVDALTARVAGLLRTALPVGHRLIHVSAAVGAAMAPDSSTTGQELLRQADVAMLKAKENGPGSSALANPTLVEAAADQLHLEIDLRAAIAHDGLALHYQPIVDSEGHLRMAEALLRWPHPQHGFLAPGVVLSVAHRAGLLAELEQWITRSALAEAATWPRAPGTEAPPGIAINISDLLANRVDFATETLQILRDCKLDPLRLVLEVTETSLVSQPERSRKAMNELTEQGVRFAVDDFGSGYSSLARLKAFPTQLIKLDQQFVAGIATDLADHAICRTAIELATAMGRDCIAEGVETRTQHHLLAQLGYTHYQGFLFAHPQPAPQLHQLLSGEDPAGRGCAAPT